MDRVKDVEVSFRGGSSAARVVSDDDSSFGRFAGRSFKSMLKVVGCGHN